MSMHQKIFHEFTLISQDLANGCVEYFGKCYVRIMKFRFHSPLLFVLPALTQGAKIDSHAMLYGTILAKTFYSVTPAE